MGYVKPVSNVDYLLTWRLLPSSAKVSILSLDSPAANHLPSELNPIAVTALLFLRKIAASFNDVPSQEYR